MNHILKLLIKMEEFLGTLEEEVFVTIFFIHFLAFFSYPVIDFVTSNYTGSKYSTMRYNYYLLLDCMTNTVEYTMSRVYLTVYPTWEIRGNNGLLIGILKVN